MNSFFLSLYSEDNLVLEGVLLAMKHLANTHDLRLSEWGPYTKKYIGVSHIADPDRGVRYDLSVFPGLYRRHTEVPNVTWESGFHPWEAAPDLSYYSFRHELEWKDRLYADISYSHITDKARLVRSEFVNRTESDQNVVLHYMSSIHYPQIGSHQERLRMAEAKLPVGAVWIDALEYGEMAFAYPRPTDHLVYDGWFRGEQREHHAVGGSVLGEGFGTDAEDRAAYSFRIDRDFEETVIVIRYKASSGLHPTFRLSGMIDQVVCLEGTGAMTTVALPAGAIKAGKYHLRFESLGEGAVMLDGFAVVEASQAGDISFPEAHSYPKPEILSGPKPNSVIYKFKDSTHYYGLLWTFPQYELREFISSELDVTMRHHVHHHGEPVLLGEGEGHFSNVFMRPIPLKPQSARILYAAVCSGTLEETKAFIAGFNDSEEACEALYESAREKMAASPVIPEGKTYSFSQRIMKATLLLNVVYPVYTQRRYIRHYTPGRWWDSLYTWDAGFIGLGLSELDKERAIDCLNAYVTDPGNDHAAFIHHGSPVPVQHYLFLELWNSVGSAEFLEHFYPRLRQYYLFQSGQAGGSTIGSMRSGLLKTWDYFYNSGGWDDYPAQVQVHANRLSDRVSPVSVTSHVIRIAKILRMAAIASEGKEQDIAGYDDDIARFAKAIDSYAWDEESGYYAYVVHDGEGNPTTILRDGKGENLNRGFDGVYPLVAGIVGADRKQTLMGRLFDDDRMWSPIGLSAVDQSAPYYVNDGYWNGTVWMAHQWFFWKTMLDLGQTEEAFRIADTALRLWKREAEDTYYSMEHFIIDSGRGAGWHQFGALSAPVLNWFTAYYRPGKANWGFDVWVRESGFQGDNDRYTAKYDFHGSDQTSFAAVVCMRPGIGYSVNLNGEPVEFIARNGGALEIKLPGNVRNGELIVEETSP